MNKVLKYFLNITKTIIIIAGVMMLQRVNVVNGTSKLSNDNLNKTIDLTAMSVKLNEMQMADKYYPLDTFTGDLTGYVADCPLCTGYLACNGQYVANGTTTFNDQDYGNVRIVASSKNLPCGSVITFDAKNVSDEKITAIVLDRGVLRTDLDLLVDSQSTAVNTVGRHKINYDVLRFGWERK